MDFKRLRIIFINGFVSSLTGLALTAVFLKILSSDPCLTVKLLFPNVHVIPKAEVSVLSYHLLANLTGSFSKDDRKRLRDSWRKIMEYIEKAINRKANPMFTLRLIQLNSYRIMIVACGRPAFPAV